jgi:hypothetical protein
MISSQEIQIASPRASVEDMISSYASPVNRIIMTSYKNAPSAERLMYYMHAGICVRIRICMHACIAPFRAFWIDEHSYGLQLQKNLTHMILQP